MPIQSEPWASRLHGLLGGLIAELTEEALQGLVDGGVREATDLDFKREVYTRDDKGKIALAGDVASMANARGGIIVLGIEEKNEVAVGLTPVTLDATEELRMQQVLADRVEPNVQVEIERIGSEGDSERGYFVVTIPPSSYRPHCVVWEIVWRSQCATEPGSGGFGRPRLLPSIEIAPSRLAGNSSSLSTSGPRR